MSYENPDIYCTCLELEAPECKETYSFMTEMENTWLSVKITDKHSKVYNFEILSDDDGFIDIDNSSLPENFFNPYAKVKLEVFFLGEPVNLVSNKGLFPCAFVRFYKEYGNDAVNFEVNQNIYVCCCGTKTIECND